MSSSDNDDIILTEEDDNNIIETIQFDEIKSRNIESSLNNIESLLINDKGVFKRNNNELSDIILRIHSVKGIPSPTKDNSPTDLYWQIDMRVSIRHKSKTVYIYHNDNDDNNDTMDAYWCEDIFIRRGNDEGLLLSLRSDSLGYNLSFGKLYFQSIEDIIKDIDDDEIISDWFPLELNFKSSDPNISYNIQVYLSFIKLPTIKYENDTSSFICSSPYSSKVSLIPNPYGSYPGSSIQCLLALHVESDGDKIEKDDFLISTSCESMAYIKGKLEKKIERGFFLQPIYDNVRISFPNTYAVMNDDGISIDKDKFAHKKRNERSSFLSFFRSPVDICFKSPKTYLWMLDIPLPGISDAIDQDNNVIKSTLPPSFQYFEPMANNEDLPSYNRLCLTKHTIKAGYIYNESIAEFNVHPLHRLDAPQLITMKFKSPFNSNDIFILKASFIVRDKNNYEFKGSIERENDDSNTLIVSASFELKSCLSFNNVNDDIVKSSFNYTFKDSSELLKETKKNVDLSASSQEPLLGYTMNTPLYSIDHYIIPTIVFSKVGEDNHVKKVLNGKSIGIYPSIGHVPDENTFEQLSNNQFDESKLKSTEIDGDKYVIFPNVYYHPNLKMLMNITNEDKALIFDRETGKQVMIKSFFSNE